MAVITRSQSEPGLSRFALPAAVALTVLGAALMAGWVILDRTMPAVVPADDTAGQIILVIPLLAVGGVAFLLMTRRPGNPVGWLLGISGCFLAQLLFASDYLSHWLYVRDLPDALVVPMEATSGLGWALGFPFLLVILPMLFPDGRLLSRKWRPVIWFGVTMGVIALIANALDPNVITDNHRHAANPIGIPGGHDVLYFIQSTLSTIFLVPMMIAGVVSQGIRYRRADADLRRQLKWFLAAVSVAVVGMFVAFGTNFSAVGFVAVSIGFTALPVSIGIGVLKYRLYDIDVVINRSVLFVTMAGFITVVYLAIVVGVGALVGSGGRSNLFLSVVATAIVGVAFQPVFNRARRVANRLAYGKRATPYEVLSELSVQLVDTYANEELLPRIARTVAEATGATGVEVRVRIGNELRSAAVWPAGAAASPPIHVAGQILPPIPGVDNALPVRHQGELLGALTLTKRAGESLSPIEQKLVSDLAGQAGLLLKNAGLTADLRARLEELRASRQRLVSAQDAERRRIERNLHDGAQQHLVALKIKLGLLEALTKKDPDRAAALASEVKGDADEALETLRDLARGIYPPLLASQGLVAALQSQARKAPLPVEVIDGGTKRYAPEIEAAVYFCCLEALQNVGKYAHATAASIRVSGVNGTLDFEVQDDGAGFDVETAMAGSGLTNMTDRIDAVGGSLVVTSAPGQGTRVAGSLPVDVAT